ncbi:MAG: DUF3857 domain-containing protein [Rhabdochlamydiaceae bacterium]
MKNKFYFNFKFNKMAEENFNMLKTIVSLFVPLLLYATALRDPPTNTFATGHPAPWVKCFEYELAPPTVKPSQVNVQYLVIDTQRNWEEKTIYKRCGIKPLTQAGVEEVSHLKLLYNPAFQNVCVHSIRVCRNGVWHDRLSTARHHVLQREGNLEMQMYSGLLTLVFFISDIRVGDVVEYQYSYMGGNPLLTTHLYDDIYLEGRASIEKMSYRLLTHPSHDLEIKSFLTNFTLNVQDISPELREWSITTSETEAHPYELNQLPSINPFARIQINEYPTWKVVIDKMAPLVTLPEIFIKDPSPEILLLLKEWTSFDPYERARLATRFVQNEIHYLSLSDGLSALKPEDPTICFTRRFGDCKDKTLLLHGLLKLMDIPSTPILVHNLMGASIPSSLPNPHLFNHMVLRIEFDSGPIFVDPTITLQGGPITGNYCPRYFFGLPLSETSSELIQMPEEILLHPIEIETTLRLKDSTTLEMIVETHYYDNEAESIRRKLAYRGLKKLSESHLLYTQSLYRGATSSEPLKTFDDPNHNLFITREAYYIPLRTKKGKNVFKIQSQLLYDYLETDINPDRKTSYAVTFPRWIREHLHIDHLILQEPTLIEEMNFDHDSFLYSSSIKRSETATDLHFEIKFLKDHIKPGEIPAFNAIMSKIESDTDLEVNFMTLNRK